MSAYEDLPDSIRKRLGLEKHLDQIKGKGDSLPRIEIYKIQPEKTVIKIYETRNRKEKLMRLFSAANKATSPKSSLPALGNVLLKAER